MLNLAQWNCCTLYGNTVSAQAGAHRVPGLLANVLLRATDDPVEDLIEDLLNHILIQTWRNKKKGVGLKPFNKSVENPWSMR